MSPIFQNKLKKEVYSTSPTYSSICSMYVHAFYFILDGIKYTKRKYKIVFF